MYLFGIRTGRKGFVSLRRLFSGYYPVSFVSFRWVKERGYYLESFIGYYPYISKRVSFHRIFSVSRIFSGSVRLFIFPVLLSGFFIFPVFLSDFFIFPVFLLFRLFVFSGESLFRGKSFPGKVFSRERLSLGRAGRYRDYLFRDYLFCIFIFSGKAISGKAFYEKAFSGKAIPGKAFYGY